MTTRDDQHLPAAVEALLRRWPAPQRSEEEWERSAADVLRRIETEDVSCADDVLQAPLPRQPDEGYLPTTGGSAPHASPHPHASRGSRPDIERPSQPRVERASRPGAERTSSPELKAGESLAALARARVPRRDRDRELRVAQQSLQHLAEARHTGETADQVARAAETRSRQSQPEVVRVAPAASNLRGVVVGGAVGLLAAAAAVFFVVQMPRHEQQNPTVVVTHVTETVEVPAASAAAPEDPMASVDELPIDAPPRSPKASTLPTQRVAQASRPRTTAEATSKGTPESAVEPDEFDTPLPHAQGRTTRLAPTTGEALAALAPGSSRARACVAGHQAHSIATITFSSDGKVDGIAVSGPAAGTPAEACIRSAFGAARVQPFAKPNFRISYPVRP